MEECEVLTFVEMLRGEFERDTGSSLMAVTLVDGISSAGFVSIEISRLACMLSSVELAEPSRLRSLRAIFTKTRE